MINAEEAVISYLNEAGFEAYADVPVERPVEFVTVEATGGAGNLFTASPSMAIQCWSATRYEASDLARRVRDSLLNIADESEGICSASVNSPYNYTKDNTPRYQMVLDVVTI